MEIKKALYETPVPSVDFSIEAECCGNVIRFAYQKDGLEFRSGLRFKRVKATRSRSESACTVWHIDAYDTLMEIESSQWADEVRADTADKQRRLGQTWTMKHYIIYLDSVGCFEFLAESWEVLDEGPEK